MRLTATTLRRLIKEETRRVLLEGRFGPGPKSNEWYDYVEDKIVRDEDYEDDPEEDLADWREEQAREIEGFSDDEDLEEFVSEEEIAKRIAAAKRGIVAAVRQFDGESAYEIVGELYGDLRDAGVSELRAKEIEEDMNELVADLMEDPYDI